MSGSRSRDPVYKIDIEEEAWTGLDSLSESAQEKVFTLWRDYLCYTPTQRIPGKLKRLRGEFSAYYQFEVTKDIRMIYAVEEDAKKVRIEYIGKHPDWSRRRRRPF